jgi:hypothetical protein
MGCGCEGARGRERERERERESVREKNGTAAIAWNKAPSRLSTLPDTATGALTDCGLPQAEKEERKKRNGLSSFDCLPSNERVERLFIIAGVARPWQPRGAHGPVNKSGCLAGRYACV